jgi:hypothetical protein
LGEEQRQFPSQPRAREGFVVTVVLPNKRE